MRYLLSLCLLAGSLAAVRQWDGGEAEATKVDKPKSSAAIQAMPRVEEIANADDGHWQCGTLLLDARARLPRQYAPQRVEVDVSRWLEKPALAEQVPSPSSPQIQILAAPELHVEDLSGPSTPLFVQKKPPPNPLGLILAGRTTGDDDLCVTFAEQDPLDVRCRYGKVLFSLKLARVATASWSWHQVAVQVAYQPRQVGRTVLLQRSEVQIDHNAPVGTAEQLQTAVESILPRELGLPGLGETLALESWAKENLTDRLQSDDRIDAPFTEEQILKRHWRIVQRPGTTRQ